MTPSVTRIPFQLSRGSGLCHCRASMSAVMPSPVLPVSFSGLLGCLGLPALLLSPVRDTWAEGQRSREALVPMTDRIPPPLWPWSCSEPESRLQWKGLIYLFIYLLFKATLMAYGSSQVRGWIGATAAGLCHSHSNTRSLNHWAGPGIKPASSWILVRFLTHWTTIGTPERDFKFQNMSQGSWHLV